MDKPTRPKASKERLAWERRQRHEAKLQRYIVQRPPEPTARRRRPDPGYTTLAGPVTITRADGTTEVRPALEPVELRRIVKDRLPISDGMRIRIYRRDGGACRYCGNDTGPFHLDHVVPVALGGATVMRNLVLACGPCNTRKGANIWKPNPLPRR